MKAKKYFKFSYLLLVSFMFIECKDLEEKVYSANAESAFFTSDKDVTAALAGMYRPMQNCCGGWGQAGTMMLNGASDEGTGADFWGTYDRLDYTPSSTGEIPDWWNQTYRAIAGANLIVDNQVKIEGIDNSVGKTISKAAIGEAKLWRGLMYFQLAQMFGGVPLRITQAKRADQTNIAKSTEGEVYAQVIADFKDAEANLPAKADKAKVSKWTATAYLAKVYLTRKDYPNALAKAKEVENSNAFSLAPKYADIFDIAKENGSEDIFTIQYIRVDGQGTRLDALSGWGITAVEPSLYGKFDTTDTRRQTTFVEPKNPKSNQGKWIDLKKVSGDGQDNNFIVYRYADLILVKAEAENEVNGPTAAAYADVNKIRKRAGIPNIKAGLTKDQFRDAVLNERNLELAMEQLRWFDLKRTGKLKDVLTAAGLGKWNDKYLLWPIPQSEIDASNGLIKQNPGY
jgi:starch-binding outer membrane protein, SusD/RagB family